MARKINPPKPYIRIFFEGESEQMYAKFLKDTFSDVAVISYPQKTGLFTFARSKYRNDPSYRSEVSALDEIWFFFDVEADEQGKWDERFKIIQELRRLRKKPHVTVRLLMTTACLEYWLMLHYRDFTPHLSTVAEKEAMLRQVQAVMPGYKKGDEKTTFQIAEHYKTAMVNGRRTLSRLTDQGLPTLENTDERNLWLCRSGHTFTTVQEAIGFLEDMNHSPE